jgi:hypothetical protein
MPSRRKMELMLKAITHNLRIIKRPIEGRNTAAMYPFVIPK